MITADPIATTVATQRHTVRLTHAATGRVLTAVRIAPVRWPAGWSGRVVDGTIVVVGPPAEPPAPGPVPERIDVIVTDGALADVLEFPPLEEDQPPNSVRVPLAADEISITLNPRAMTFAVTVAGNPAPAAAFVVAVRAASGTPTVPLALGADGAYSATQVWGAEFINADLLVGDTPVRKVSLDYTRITTRIHVVNPN